MTSSIDKGRRDRLGVFGGGGAKGAIWGIYTGAAGRKRIKNISSSSKDFNIGYCITESTEKKGTITTSRSIEHPSVLF
jgi:hypothetical protein